MTPKPPDPGRFSLRRWSQRKLEVARAEGQAVAETPKPATQAVADAQGSADARQGASKAIATPAAVAPANAELPPIESLTIDSDFTPFFRPDVDQAVKRAALKQLFRDPRFNVMDGLDTYIDDYTQPDPIPEAMLEDLMRRRVFFAPSEVATDHGEPAISEPVKDRDVPSTEATASVAAPVAAIAVAPPESSAPAIPAENALPQPAEPAARRDAGAQDGKP